MVPVTHQVNTNTGYLNTPRDGWLDLSKCSPGDEGGDHTEYQHGDRAGPDGDLAAVSVRHQAGTEGAQGEAGEEKHLGESLEPTPLTHEVPLGHHGGHPELLVKLVVDTAGHTVTQQLLVLSGVAWVR